MIKLKIYIEFYVLRKIIKIYKKVESKYYNFFFNIEFLNSWNLYRLLHTLQLFLR